jgi:hypothetical protein
MRLAGLAIFAGLLAAAGCAGGPHNQPAWVTQHLAQAPHSYPNLHDVPRTNNVNTDAQHWAAVKADTEAAGTSMRADPRNQPAPPTDPNAFINDAQHTIDQTRQAHSNN